MDGCNLFLYRIQALNQELDRTEEAMKRIDPEFSHRVSGFLGSQFEECREILKQLVGSIRKVGIGENLREQWLELEKLSRCTCEPLFRECLTLMQGALLRSCAHTKLCEIADALLYRLSDDIGIHWDLFTILSHEELIPMRDMPEIIRLRFPDVSIWNLPIVGHEFGHFVGFKLETLQAGDHYHPFLDFMERKCRQNSEQCPAHLHEYSADLFAAYAFGPSYAFNCILLRFDPLKAFEESDSHPCQAKRVYWILKTLDELGRAETGQNRYGGYISYLRDAWEKGIEATSIPGAPLAQIGKDQIQQLDVLFEELYPLFEYKLRVVRYKADDWHRATQLSYEINNGTFKNLRGDISIIDLINAFWLCRIGHGVRKIALLQELGKQAIELCCLLKDRRVSE